MLIWCLTLKSFTGRDPKVAAFVMADPNFEKFKTQLLDLITFLIPLYVEEGKTHLTIAFGCTGGRHRSVMMAELMGSHFADYTRRINIVHRDTPMERRRKSD
jgi:RNase adapter protein RapZ